MPGCRAVLKGLWSTVAFAAGTVAAVAFADESPQFSISPFGGYRVGGGFRLSDTGQLISLGDAAAFALAVDARAEEGREYELFYSRQSTELRGNGFAPVDTVVEYLHVGGTVALYDEGRIRPYLGGGLGVTRLSPGLAPGSSDTRFSVSLALGLRAPLTQHWSARVEARGYFTPINTQTALFCQSNRGGAVCLVQARGSSFYQGDFLAGVTYAF